ncbi:unnamed protein product [Periconia digitata]|uniref:Uncharacterized protein n=1 Tax=Periconia digitata TaxID=1303443 RepID=A0A9W4U709_9PLEO|nr:unnamed protein product [Periconia digitata]
MKQRLQPPRSLLSLPRELRDQIYTYALYEDEGIYYYRPHKLQKPIFIRNYDSTHMAVNQLKYTCHQLRSETLNMELGLNRLTFLGDPTISLETRRVKEDPESHFLEFIGLCSERMRRRLRCIYLPYGHRIRHYRCIGPRDVVLFCERYPHITVWWQTRFLEEEFYRVNKPAERILEGGAMLAALLRTGVDLQHFQDSMLIDLKSDSILQYLARCLTGQDMVERGYYSRTFKMKAGNFRVLPAVEGDWETECRERWEGWVAYWAIENRVWWIKRYLCYGI